jgi:hypothetical protein
MAPKASTKAAKAPAATKAIKKKEKKEKPEKVAKEDKPKRAPGPYMVFCKEERPKILEENPGFGFGEVGKALGAAWGRLSDEEKASYKREV